MLPLKVNYCSLKIPLYCIGSVLALGLLGLWSPPISVAAWHAVHNSLVFTGIILSFVIFFLSWYGAVRISGVHITVISLAMLWVSVLDAAHLLTSPSLHQTVSAADHQVWLLYWIFARLIWACSILYVAKTQISDSVYSGMHKAVLVFAALLIAVFTANVYISAHFWPQIVTDIIQPLMKTLSYACVLMQSVALWLVCKQNKKRLSVHFLSRAIIFGLLADMSFTIAMHDPSFLSLVGHFFTLTAYYYLLRSIYIIVIRKPYEDVQAMKDEMEALAANNEHLYQASLKQCDMMEETLTKLGTLISSKLNLEDTYRAIADMVTDMMDASQSCVALVSDNRESLTIAATYGISSPPETIAFEGSLIGAAIAARKAQVINDLSVRPDIFRPQLIFSDIQSIISAPLFDDQQIIGGVEAYSSEKNAFSQHDCLLLQALGRYAGAAIACARQFEETKLRLSEEQFLYQITQATASTMDPDMILAQSLPVIMQALQAENGMCLTCSDSCNLLSVKTSINCQIDLKEIELPQNHELLTIIHGLQPGSIKAEGLPGYSDKRNGNLLCLPLVVDHRALGLILLGWQKKSLPEQRRPAFAALMAQQIALGLEKAQLYIQVKTMALSDGLTGLANRRNFDMFLESELRRSTSLKRPLSLIMFDLDRFKSYNDTYGHLVGDKLLAQIGRILRDNVRGIDFPARYGGEEFSIILPECSNAEASTIAEKIRLTVELCQFPDSQGGFSARITASLGVATYDPLLLPNPPSKDLMIAIADRALYQAKEEGRNRVNSATVIGQ